MNAVKIYEHAKWKLEHNEITLGEFEKMIKSLEDVVEVKHGEWKCNVGNLRGDVWYECNCCGCVPYDKSNFCPNCGADMRGENKSE